MHNMCVVYNAFLECGKQEFNQFVSHITNEMGGLHTLVVGEGLPLMLLALQAKELFTQ